MKLAGERMKKMAKVLCPARVEISIVVFVLLLTASIFAGVVPTIAQASPTTIYVPDDYAKIQWAVDNASAGDTVIVRDGTYPENVNVNVDNLTIQSENGSDSTIVLAENPSEHVFNVTADYVNISGFTAIGATGNPFRAGIDLFYANRCNISNNYCSNNKVGVGLEFSSSINLINNIANSNRNHGILITRSANNTLIDNIANSNGECGIYLWEDSSHERTNNNTLVNNTAHSNGDYGIHLYNSLNNTLIDNNATNNHDGIFIHVSNNNTLITNIASSNNWDGIILNTAQNNSLSDNSALNNYRVGINLRHYSSTNKVNNNILSGNTDGIRVVSSSDNIITRNKVINNGGDGIYLGKMEGYPGSHNNRIYLNDFINNTNNVYSSSFSTNIWNSTSPLSYTYNGTTFTNYLGNYWDDYSDVDTDNNGIWDNPYTTSGDKDWYPLKEGFENYFAPTSPQPSTIQLPQTGQIKCYDTQGIEIACAGTGQDGEIKAGVAWPHPRFVDNNDGTISDMLTGLMWLKDGNCFGEQTWSSSLEKIEDFNAHPNSYSCQDYTAHYTDWRLPDINELESLLNTEQQFPSTWLNDQGFRNVQYNWYWTSTTRAYSAGSAWTMSMMVGWVSSHGKEGGTGTYFLPVRSGQFGSVDPNYPANIWKTGQKTSYFPRDDGDIQAGVSWPTNRFMDNGDGTVTDTLTGLMWAKDAGSPTIETCSIVSMTWQNDLDYVKCLNSNAYLSYNDWRLPNRKELFSLIDYSQCYPALPSGHPFTNLPLDLSNRQYWSSTTVGAHSYGRGVAWLMQLLYEGGIGGDWKNNQYNNNYFAWPVRGGTITITPTNLLQLKSDGTTVIPVGGMTDERTVYFKGTVSDPDGDRVKLQVELRNLNEYGGQFDETKGGLKDSDLVASGSEAVVLAIELIDEDYHWRARAVDEHGELGEWVEFGNNDISEADFTVAGITYSYNPQAAVNYAEKHWKNYNSTDEKLCDYYQNYSGRGGDCANFVSQCLIAGGLDLSIHPGRDTCGSIINCTNLHDFLVNYLGVTWDTRYKSEEYPEWFKPGDPAIFGYSDAHPRTHAVFAVTGYTTPATCNAHSDNTNHSTISDFYDANPSFDRCTFYHILSPAKPVLTSPLKITPEKDTYYVGDTLTAEFTITNIGDVPITLDKLLLGGRFNDDKLPNGEYPDFTFNSTTLQPNVPHQYTGTLTLTHSGNYHFFIAYYIENPTPEEKALLDENNWNTCVDLGEGLTDEDRTEDISTAPGYAIIVAGQADWRQKSAIDHSANNAYRVLRNLGFDDDHIFYLNSNQPQDVDGDGDSEVDALALLSLFENAINQVKAEIGDNPTPLVFYLTGHGLNDPDCFIFDEGNPSEGYLWVAKFQEELDKFSEGTPMLIVIGSCYSGRFITSNEGVSAPNRIILSTGINCAFLSAGS
jgi:parallel beta-helix repeat protein